MEVGHQNRHIMSTNASIAFSKFLPNILSQVLFLYNLDWSIFNKKEDDSTSFLVFLVPFSIGRIGRLSRGRLARSGRGRRNGRSGSSEFRVDNGPDIKIFKNCLTVDGPSRVIVTFIIKLLDMILVACSFGRHIELKPS